MRSSRRASFARLWFQERKGKTKSFSLTNVSLSSFLLVYAWSTNPTKRQLAKKTNERRRDRVGIEVKIRERPNQSALEVLPLALEAGGAKARIRSVPARRFGSIFIPSLFLSASVSVGLKMSLSLCLSARVSVGLKLSRSHSGSVPPISWVRFPPPFSLS